MTAPLRGLLTSCVAVTYGTPRRRSRPMTAAAASVAMPRRWNSRRRPEPRARVARAGTLTYPYRALVPLRQTA